MENDGEASIGERYLHASSCPPLCPWHFQRVIRMAPAVISAEAALSAHADAQAAACKDFLNLVVDVKDSTAVTECYR